MPSNASSGQDLYFVLDFPIPVEPEVEPNVTKRCIIKFPNREAVPANDRDGSVTPEWSPEQPVVRHSSKKDNIQITDLHTRHPMVAYKGQVYSCNWATTLGTDMLFSRPTERNQDLADTSSRLVATTAAKLVATPVEVQPKEHNELQLPPVQSPIVDDQDGGILQEVRTQKQAQFLERIQAAKRSRGETGTVPTEPILTLKRPVDWIDQEKHDQARKEHEDRRRRFRPTEHDHTEGAPRTRSRKKKTQADASANGQPTLSRSGKRLGRPPGKKTDGLLRNLLKFNDASGQGGNVQEVNGDLDSGNDSLPISTPTPVRFEFVESENGQRVATVPRDLALDFEMDGANSSLDTETTEDSEE